MEIDMNWITDSLNALKTKTGLAGLLYAAQGPINHFLSGSASVDAVGNLLKSFTLRDILTGAAIVWARAAIAKVGKK
jgi:hypothetical protein